MSAPLELETEVLVPERTTLGGLLGSIGGALVLLLFVPELARRGPRRLLPHDLSFSRLRTLLDGLLHTFRGPRFQPARVRIDGATVRLGGHVLERATIRSAHWAPPARGARGVVQLIDAEGRTLGIIAAADGDAAAALLGALGLEIHQATASFSGAPPRWSTAWFALLATFGGGLAVAFAGVQSQTAGLQGLGLLVAVLGSLLLLRTEISVGADGVVVTTRLDQRFVPWSEVQSVSPSWRGVVMQTRSGRLALPMTTRFWLMPREAAEQRAFLQRATQALQAYRSEPRLAAEARLARGTRSQAEWLRDLLDREGDFRQAPLPDEQVWGVLESAAADASARAGAAAVLGRCGEPEARNRLRVAASACSAPELRVVLDRAAEGARGADVEQAMAEVAEAQAEAESKRARRTTKA